MIEWKEMYSLDNKEIDEQHKVLIDILKEIDDGIKIQNVNYLTLVDMIHRLETYVKEHFEYEEELMNQASYPYIKEHTQEHNKFRYKIQTTYALDIDKPEEFHVDMACYLSDWLIHHIKNVDGQFCKYLMNQ